LPTNGYASCIAAGKRKLPTTKWPTSMPFNAAAHRCSGTSPLQAKQV